MDFTLLGPAPIKGDVGPEVDQVSLQLATDRLTSSFGAGLFQLYYVPAPGVSTSKIIITPLLLYIW